MLHKLLKSSPFHKLFAASIFMDYAFNTICVVVIVNFPLYEGPVSGTGGLPGNIAGTVIVIV
jgi:hypothetical protein